MNALYTNKSNDLFTSPKRRRSQQKIKKIQISPEYPIIIPTTITNDVLKPSLSRRPSLDTRTSISRKRRSASVTIIDAQEAEDIYVPKMMSESKRSTFQDAEKLLPFPYDFSEKILWEIIQSLKDEKKGVQVREVSLSKNKKKKCFTGQEIVVWFILNWSSSLGSTINLINGERERAISLCKMLVELGIIEKSIKDGKDDFSDDNTYFSFHKDGINWTDMRKYVKRFNEMKTIIQLVNNNTKVISLVSNLMENVEIKDRKVRHKVLPQCFVASECVDWLSKNYNLSRRSAVRLGEFLRQAGAIERVFESSSFRISTTSFDDYFEDEDHFYNLKLNFFDKNFTTNSLAATLL